MDLFFTRTPVEPDHVIERARIAADVVGGVAADQVLIVRSAIENHVAGRRQLTGGGIIGGLVGVQGAGAKANFDVASHVVDVLVFLLLVGTNQHFVAAQRNIDGRRLRA